MPSTPILPSEMNVASTNAASEPAQPADDASLVNQSAELGRPLPDPDHVPGRPVVLFDGHCEFCKASVGLLRRFDWGDRKLSYLSMHDERVAKRYPRLSAERMTREMVIVQPDGTDHGGSDAVRLLSRLLPTLWWAMPVLHFPGTAWLWRWLYAMVAKNRYRIMGRSCDSGGCRIG